MVTQKYFKETRKKLGLVNGKKKLSEEHKRKLNLANTGRVWSEKARKKISILHKGRIFSKEHKRKISLIHKGTTLSEKHKKQIRAARAKQVLPIKDTTIEIKIQNFLKELNIDFLTHQYIKEIEHGYQCDILIPSMNLVIECDGNYWHKYPIGKDIDHIRTKELIEKGFKVLRLWERDIRKMNRDDFKNKLKIKKLAR